MVSMPMSMPCSALQASVKRPRNSFIVFWVCASDTAAIWIQERGWGFAIGSPGSRPMEANSASPAA